MKKNIEEGVKRIALVIWAIWTLILFPGIVWPFINKCFFGLGVFNNFSICYDRLELILLLIVIIPVVIYFIVYFIWKGFTGNWDDKDK